MHDREIKTIGFGRATRDRVGMYLSADPQKAIELGLREVYVNSLDALMETGTKNGEILIKITSAKRQIEVTDNGPGIPNAIRKDGKHSLVAAYTMAHTGSHFDGKEVNSIGLNGIGASVVTHTAKDFYVRSTDKKSTYEASFSGTSEGAVVKDIRECSKQPTSGVYVKYSPDPAVYEDAWIKESDLLEALEEMMRFYPRVSVEVNFDGKVTKFHFPNGLKDSNTHMYYESESLILALSATEGPIKAFGNRLYLPDGGNFFTQFKTQLTKKVNDLTDIKLTGAQVQAVFSGYVAVFVGSPMFSNQSKTAISNKEVNTEVTHAVAQELEAFSKTPLWGKIVAKLETELKAEQAAEKARQKVKNALNEIDKGSKKKVIAADKLKDCLNSGEDAWLAITEGDSAQGALNLCRDIYSVATFPIRGKIINALKNSKEDFLSNAEVVQIAQILGCGVYENYNPSKLKYGKVLIAVDADSDGLSIATLLMTFFYVCMPSFIKEGRLYWMRAPLYARGTDEFIFTEEEWKKVKNKKGFTRLKGLGEMCASQAGPALFGEYKRWEQLKPVNWKMFEASIQDLMGKDVSTRRDILFSRVDFSKITFM